MIHSAPAASFASSGGSADTRPNHRAPSGVAAASSSTPEAASASTRAKRRSAGIGRGWSSCETITSLNAKPRLRSVNVAPDSAGHSARLSSAIGMRLMPAADSGIARKLMSGVADNGR